VDGDYIGRSERVEVSKTIGCVHKKVLYGGIQSDDYEGRKWQLCFCMNCGEQLHADLRHGRVEYWWENRHFVDEYRNGIVELADATE
jgi:hypothetical protein